jgi:hypothetical protein
VADFFEQGQGFQARAAGRLPEQGGGQVAALFGQTGERADQCQLRQRGGTAQGFAEGGANGGRQFFRGVLLAENGVEKNHVRRSMIMLARPPPKPIRLSSAR